MTTPQTHATPDSRPTTIAGYAMAIRKALEYRGVDPARVFNAAQVPQELSNDPLHRLNIDEFTRLFKLSTEATGDPYFGLWVAKFFHVSNAHALGHALLASNSLLDLCKRLERYFRLLSQVGTIEVREDSSEVALITHPLFQPCTETEDAWLALVVRFMREAFRRDFKPLRVQFMHDCPSAGMQPYEQYFGCHVEFGYPSATLAFNRAEMDRQLPGACAEIAQLNDQLAASYIVKIERSDSVAMARSAIVGLLAAGDCTRRRVADILHVSEATLQLRLAERNTSFQALLDDTRRELACNYMQQAAMSVTEITFMLGYTDVSNFTRAFKRWTGQSPSSFRKPVGAS